MSERDIQKLCMDWLAANKVWHVRMNSGALSATHNGKRRFFRWGLPGMADILAYGRGKVYWLEVKAAKGKQSEDQELFQAEVEAEGMRYAIVRSLEDLECVFGEQRG